VSDKDVDEDIKRVTMLEKKWAEDSNPESVDVKMKASIAEFIIYKNLGKWMNYLANPMITSKADDYLRGIDLVIESTVVEEGENPDIKHLGIGIDVALASEIGASNAVEKKTKKVLGMLSTGKMAEARYVEGEFEGKIEDLSYTILSVSPSHIENLFGSSIVSEGTEKEKNHILKHIVAYQIIRQLGTYYAVADHRGHANMANSLAIANNFGIDVFGHLIEEIQTMPEIWEKVKNDPGTKEIEQFCTELELGLTKS
jgi:hypothetical protein